LVSDVIKDFNSKDIHSAKVNKLISQDIDLEPYTDYEVHLKTQQWKNQ
jgi:hypothetical protein